MMASEALSYIARHGSTLLSNGYSAMPIKPSDKAPGRWDSLKSEWVNASGWQNYCDRVPTDVEMDRWSLWPDAGVGFACGRIVGIDIDVADQRAALRLQELAFEMLGETPLVRIGQAPKRLLVYRCDVPFVSFDTKPLQVLAKGRQFVAYGIHPVTQRPYEWIFGAPDNVDRESLPNITEADARAWIAKGAKLIGLEPPSPRVSVSQAIQEPATHAAVEQALTFIPSQGIPRADWVTIGMAIKAGLGEAGRDLWHDWSARDDRYTAKESDYQWNSFGDRAGGIGVGTLYDRAMAHAWHPDGVYLYQCDEDAAALAIDVDFPTLITNIWKRSPKPAASETNPTLDISPIYTIPVGEPGWLRDLGGGLRMFVDFTRDQSHRDQPELALAAALPVFGTLAGRRYQNETGLLTNIYTVGIAGSASGKEVAIGIGTRLLEAANQIEMVGGEDFASGRAIVSAVHASPSVFFALDEFGKMLSRATSPNSRSSHEAEIIKMLLTMYSASQRIFSGVAHADRTLNKPKIIARPCLSIYGPTTGSTFWKALTSGEAIDGTLARMLVFESSNSYPDQRRTSWKAMPAELVDIAKRVVAGADGHDAFKLGVGPHQAPNPFVVRLAEGVRPLDDELMAELTCRLRDAEGSAAEPIYGRVREILLKVAMIRAIANNPGNPVIDASDFVWSRDLTVSRADAMIKAIGMNVADNEQEATLKRVLRIIDAAGPGGITAGALSRKTQFLKGRERERREIVEDLKSSGQVNTVVIKDTGGKPLTTYFAA